MNYYSNEYSLKQTYGDNEVSGLLKAAPGVDSAVRLEKACKSAFDEINNYLRSGGYLLPLTFTPFTVKVVGDLDGQLQAISDAFVAWYLAASTDLQKKRYEDQRNQGLAVLDLIRRDGLKLDLEKTECPTGIGETVVKARPRVFNKDQKTEFQTIRGRKFEF